MALDQSALIELLEMMRSADENDLMRRLLGTDVAGACGRGDERVYRRGAPCECASLNWPHLEP